MGEQAEPTFDEVHRTARTPEQFRTALERWLASRRPGAAITGLEIPSSNGMSSETVLFDAAWRRRRHRRTAARRPGRPGGRRRPGVPDLRPRAPGQGDDRRPGGGAVGADPRGASSTEPDAGAARHAVLRDGAGRRPGAARRHAVQLRLLGQPRPRREERATLQESSVDVLAAPARHRRRRRAASPTSRSTAPAPRPCAASSPTRRPTTSGPAEGLRVPLDRADLRLARRALPRRRGRRRAVLGRRPHRQHALRRASTPAAVLDWEMAVLAPPEVDLAWFAYLHTFFEDLAGVFGVPGLPDFLRLDDCAADLRAAVGPRRRGTCTGTRCTPPSGTPSCRSARRSGGSTSTSIDFPEDPDDLDHAPGRPRAAPRPASTRLRSGAADADTRIGCPESGLRRHRAEVGEAARGVGADAHVLEQAPALLRRRRWRGRRGRSSRRRPMPGGLGSTCSRARPAATTSRPSQRPWFHSGSPP